ncbi:hypothetical protein [Treponema zioleckii]|nr:hypothetical protein [Treponema zioleckii]
MFKQLESNGAEITGSQNLYVNEAKTKVFYNTGVSFQGETAAIRLVMQKQ